MAAVPINVNTTRRERFMGHLRSKKKVNLGDSDTPAPERQAKADRFTGSCSAAHSFILPPDAARNRCRRTAKDFRDVQKRPTASFRALIDR
jgi:hypothetical protein